MTVVLFQECLVLLVSVGSCTSTKEAGLTWGKIRGTSIDPNML